MDKEKNKKKKTTKITKKDNKKRFNLSLGIIVLIVVAASILAAGISAYAATTLINSREVKYDNSTSGINATNVQDAIVELNNNATDYSTIISRLNALEGKIYPVGSIYISVSNTNPGTFLGGTWESFGQGRTIIGVNASDGDYNAAEKTGGSKTKTLAVANLPSHSHSIPALSGTAASAGGHTHTWSGTTSSAGGHTHTWSGTTSSAGDHSHTVYGIRPHNWYTTNVHLDFQNDGNLVIYKSNGTAIWASGTGGNGGSAYRAMDIGQDGTSSSNGSHTHSYSGTTSNNGAHTHTYSGTTSSNGAHTHTVSTNASTTGSSGSGTAFSTMDPYITVYMWKRTA